MGMLAPSMMCAQIDKLDETLRAFEKAGIEYLHIDVMDGCFVPNLMLGTDYVKQLRKLTSIPLDIHLMITEPEKKISWFDFQPGEFVSVHYESTKNWRQALQLVRDAGAKPLAAINPPTPVSVLEDVIDLIDGVLVMTVNPGFAGQKAVPETIAKIHETRELLARHGLAHLPIEVDGNCSFEMAPKMRAQSADIFVCGSSSVFTKSMPMDEAIAKFRECVK